MLSGTNLAVTGLVVNTGVGAGLFDVTPEPDPDADMGIEESLAATGTIVGATICTVGSTVGLSTGETSRES